MYKLILKLQSQIQQTPSVKGQRVDFIDAVGMWARCCFSAVLGCREKAVVDRRQIAGCIKTFAKFFN